MSHRIQLRRVYDDPAPEDGVRILVDRLWPRGLIKEEAHLDEWSKEVAPSPELRTWYGHDPSRFSEFRRRYAAELADPVRVAALSRLGELADEKQVTLLTATKDLDHSHAAVLLERLSDDN